MNDGNYMVVPGGAAHLRTEQLKIATKGLEPAFFASEKHVRKFERIKNSMISKSNKVVAAVGVIGFFVGDRKGTNLARPAVKCCFLDC